MAINKASMVLLTLFAVAAISDAARFDSSLELNKQSDQSQEFCSTCECEEVDGVTKCVRYERMIGGCPLACRNRCACFGIFQVCVCNYEVETCSPPACPTVGSTIGFKDLIIHQLKP